MFTREISNQGNLKRKETEVSLNKLAETQNSWLSDLESFICDNGCTPEHKNLEDRLLYSRMNLMKSEKTDYFCAPFREEVKAYGAKNKRFQPLGMTRNSKRPSLSKKTIKETSIVMEQEFSLLFGKEFKEKEENHKITNQKGNPENLVPFKKMEEIEGLVSSQDSLGFDKLGPREKKKRGGLVRNKKKKYNFFPYILSILLLLSLVLGTILW